MLVTPADPVYPERALAERMQRLAFAAHNYGNPVIGFRADMVASERIEASVYRAPF